MYQGLKTRRACRTDLPQAFGKLILYPIYTSGKDNEYFYRIVGMTLLDHRKKIDENILDRKKDQGRWAATFKSVAHSGEYRNKTTRILQPCL